MPSNLFERGGGALAQLQSGSQYYKLRVKIFKIGVTILQNLGQNIQNRGHNITIFNNIKLKRLEDPLIV